MYSSYSFFTKDHESAVPGCPTGPHLPVTERESGRLGVLTKRVSRAAMSVLIGASVLVASTGTAKAADLAPTNFPTNFRTFAMGGAHVALAEELSTAVINPAALDTVGPHISLSLGAAGTFLDAIKEFGGASDDLDALSGLEGDYALNGLAQGGFQDFGLSATVDGNVHVRHDSEGENKESYEVDGGYVAAGQVGIAIPLIDAPMGLGNLTVGASAKVLHGYKTETAMNITKDPDNAASGDKTVRNLNGTGLGLGLGALLRVTDWVTVGVAVNDIASKIKWEGEETVYTDPTYDPDTGVVEWGTEDDPRSISRTETRDTYGQIGVSVQPPLLGLVAAADIYSNGTVSYGLEKSLFFGLIALRLGQIQPADGSGAITSGGIGSSFGPASVGIAAQSSDAAGLEVVAGATVKF